MVEGGLGKGLGGWGIGIWRAAWSIWIWLAAWSMCIWLAGAKELEMERAEEEGKRASAAP